MSRGIVTPSTTHPAPLGWNNPPDPPPLECLRKPCNRSQMPSGHQQPGGGHSKGGVGLKSAPGDPPRIFQQQVESETIPLQVIPTTPPIPQKVPHKVSRAKRSGTFRSKTGSGEAPSALRKNPSIPRFATFRHQCPSSSIPNASGGAKAQPGPPEEEKPQNCLKRIRCSLDLLDQGWIRE